MCRNSQSLILIKKDQIGSCYFYIFQRTGKGRTMNKTDHVYKV